MATDVIFKGGADFKDYLTPSTVIGLVRSYIKKDSLYSVTRSDTYRVSIRTEAEEGYTYILLDGISPYHPIYGATPTKGLKDIEIVVTGRPVMLGVEGVCGKVSPNEPWRFMIDEGRMYMHTMEYEVVGYPTPEFISALLEDVANKVHEKFPTYRISVAYEAILNPYPTVRRLPDPYIVEDDRFPVVPALR